jgi:hypothetical protein
MSVGLGVVVPRLATSPKLKETHVPFTGKSFSDVLMDVLSDVNAHSVPEDKISSIQPMREKDKASAQDIRADANIKWKNKKNRREQSSTERVVRTSQFRVGKQSISKAISTWAKTVRKLIDMVNDCHRLDPDHYNKVVKMLIRNRQFKDLYESGKIVQLGQGRKSDVNCLWRSLADFEHLLDGVQGDDNDWIEIRNSVIEYIKSNPGAFVYIDSNLHRVSSLFSDEVVGRLLSDDPAPNTVLAAYCALHGRRVRYYTSTNTMTYGCSGLEVPLVYSLGGKYGHWRLNRRRAVLNINNYALDGLIDYQVSATTATTQNQEAEQSSPFQEVPSPQPESPHGTSSLIDDFSEDVPAQSVVMVDVQGDPHQRDNGTTDKTVEDVVDNSAPVNNVVEQICIPPAPTQDGQPTIQTTVTGLTNDDKPLRAYQYTFHNHTGTWVRRATSLVLGGLTGLAFYLRGHKGAGISFTALGAVMAATIVDRVHASVVFRNPQERPFTRNTLVDTESTQPSIYVDAEISMTPVRLRFIPCNIPGVSRIFDWYRRWFTRDRYLYHKTENISLQVFDASLVANSNAGFMTEEVAFDHIFRLYRTQQDYHLDFSSLFSSDFATRCSMLVYKMRRDEQLGFLESLSKMRR